MLRGALVKRLASSLLGTPPAPTWCGALPQALGQCCSTSGRTTSTSARATHTTRRRFASSSGSEEGDYTAEVDAINASFVEAREEIEYAREDAETVYFNESAETARVAVQDVLGRWQDLLGRLPADEQGKLQRSMGLKIEQLRAELKELDELHA